MTQATTPASVSSRTIAVEHVRISSGRSFAEGRGRFGGGATVTMARRAVVIAITIWPRFGVPDRSHRASRPPFWRASALLWPRPGGTLIGATFVKDYTTVHSAFIPICKD
jgi:hypothetical protein